MSILTKLGKLSKSFGFRKMHSYVYDPDSMYKTFKKFEPSLGKTGESKIESHMLFIKPVNINQVIAARNAQFPSVLDKLVLVKMGKYRRYKDVPNTPKSNLDLNVADKKLKQKIIGEMLESSAKFFFILQYSLWFVSVCFCVPVFYLHSKTS